MKNYKFATFVAFAAFTVFTLGALGGANCISASPPPAVSVSVDASAQLAIEEEAPVLPDDFAKNDPPRVSASWLADEKAPQAATAGKEGAKSNVATLFTSDGTWKCLACDVQSRHLFESKPKFAFTTVPIPAAGESPVGLVPVWKAPDGTIFEGAMRTADLEKWIGEHRQKEQAAQGKAVSENSAEELKPMSVVQVDGSSSSAVFAALLEHVNRAEIAHKSANNKLAAQSWLPEIDVDLSDPLLAVLDAMMSKDGYKLGGLKVSWPAGKRAMVFDPPVDVAYRKVLEVSSKVKSVEVDGRVVVIRLDGRLINDLKVRLK
jgi:hypothetical protein